jgi:hypothetical protein
MAEASSTGLSWIEQCAFTKHEARCEMKAVTGVFQSQSQAQQAARKLQASGLPTDKITVLTPGHPVREEAETVPIDATEQPGIGTTIGALVGGAVGLSGGLVAAVIPGVGMVSALGLLGAAILTLAGASVGAVAGSMSENFVTQGLPEDEIFVYEDALRRGRSVVIALGADEAEATRLRKLLEAEGAETIDAAREQWWIGLRSAEQEHYEQSRRKFGDDEKFYRLGFEAALHARSRCKEFDQVASEMASDLEDLQRQYPGVALEEPYTRGYQRGREYYQHLCDESKAA